MGSDRSQQLSDERVNVIGNDEIESTGLVLNVTVERRVGGVDQLRHARDAGRIVKLTGARNRALLSFADIE
jgi:hypothetical protein